MNEMQKEQIRKLRKQGKTFSEIKKEVNLVISKSYLSYLCKGIILSKKSRSRIEKIIFNNLGVARLKAQKIKKEDRRAYFEKLYGKNKYLKKLSCNKDVAKLMLVCLYMAEGGKQKGSLKFGNSDPEIIKLFLKLLEISFSLEKDKFRCTLQCRFDQDVKKLEKFWSIVTKIPLTQFYSPQIDKRSLGKRTKKKDYKGVCRIDYFSASIFNELIVISKIIAS